MLETGTTWEWLLKGFQFELEATCKRATVDYYCGEVARFIRWAEGAGIPSDPLLITSRHIYEFFHHLSLKCPINGARAKSTPIERRRWPYYRALRRFFSWALKEGYVDEDPTEGLRMKAPEPSPIEPYGPVEIRRMSDVLDHEWGMARTARQRMLVARNRAILNLFVESALRLEELATLRVGDIDLQRGRVNVRFGKLGKSRLTGFGPQTRKAIWKYLGLRAPIMTDNALWATEEGKPLSVAGVQTVIRRLKKDAGLEDMEGSVHKLRHTAATTYYRHTRDMKGTRLLLGHSTTAMTERYTQFVDSEDALAAYDRQGPLDWLLE